MAYSKLSPVITGVSRHLSDDHDDPKELMRAVREAVKNRELDGGVQWHGSIAGHAQGLGYDSNDLPILITSEAKIPQPAPGDAPTISEIISGAFADPSRDDGLHELAIRSIQGCQRALPHPLSHARACR
jgi:hypothetical protein